MTMVIDRSAPAASPAEQARAARALLEVDLDAISHNVAAIRRLSPGSRVMAILKGDAYGVGARQVAVLLQRHSVEAFGVDNVAEGIELREAGIAAPILVLDGCLPELASLALAYNLMPGIANEQLLAAYDGAARSEGRIVDVWLYHNCGFNRSGAATLAGFAQLADAASRCRWLRVRAVYSHLTESHDAPRASEIQIARYWQAVACAKQSLGDAIETSLFASHGLVAFAHHMPTDWVRPGILLYGAECFTEEGRTADARERLADLRSALTLSARVLNQLRFERTQPIGYGHAVEVRPNQIVGTVAFGFGHGLPTRCARSSYTFGSRQLPMIGVVGMDYSQIDLSGCPELQPYDWVTIFGDPARGAHSFAQFAEQLNVNPYVLMRQLNVSRAYRSSANRRNEATHAV